MTNVVTDKLWMFSILFFYYQLFLYHISNNNHKILLGISYGPGPVLNILHIKFHCSPHQSILSWVHLLSPFYRMETSSNLPRS